MIPNFWTISALSTESYLILLFWSILGLVFFRYIFNKDVLRRFGKSTVVWVVFLMLIFFISMLWLRESTHDNTGLVLNNLNNYNAHELAEHGVSLTENENADAIHYIQKQMEFVNSGLTKGNIVQMGLVTMALLILFNIYNQLMKRENNLEIKKRQAESSNRAKSVFLSNMSHDIRTPMNAIVGFTGLAKKEDGIPAKARDYLEKIEHSSNLLLALINDILDMSRIESGKMTLEIERCDLVKTMDEMRNLFALQMNAKKITFSVISDEVTDKVVLCDQKKLNRVLQNLVSNAFKFTPEGGSVTVTLSQSAVHEGIGAYMLRVKDTGMGMSREFASHVFSAFERERTASNIQGTGLGMAITKSIVELMDGTIDVSTEQGKGTEFTLHFSFKLAEEEGVEVKTQAETPAAPGMDFSNVRLLLVEDNEINREIATLILEEAGFVVKTAENGKMAVDMVANSTPGHFNAILMDVQMPVMNGYEATKAIRSLPSKELASVPIIAMTANAFAEDVQAAKNAGMDGHIAKPINISTVLNTIASVIKVKK